MNCCDVLQPALPESKHSEDLWNRRVPKGAQVMLRFRSGPVYDMFVSLSLPAACNMFEAYKKCNCELIRPA